MIEPDLQPLGPDDPIPTHRLEDLEDFLGLSIEEILALDEAKSREIIEGMEVDPIKTRTAIVQTLLDLERAPRRSATTEPSLDWTPAVLARFKVVPFIPRGWVRHQMKAGLGAEDVKTLAGFLDHCAEPLLPIHFRPIMTGAMIQNGGTVEDLALLDKLVFIPWITPQRRDLLKTEIHGQSPAGAAAPSPGPTADVHGVGRFVAEACVLGPGATCRPADLFRHYRTWAEGAGLPVLGKGGFYRKMKACVPSVRRGRPKGPDGKQSSTNMFVGIRPR